jgi:hypothetical protein
MASLNSQALSSFLVKFISFLKFPPRQEHREKVVKIISFKNSSILNTFPESLFYVKQQTLVLIYE